MAESNALVKRVNVDPALTGRDRLLLMIRAAGYKGVAAWARSAAQRHQEPAITEKSTWHVLCGRRLTSPASQKVITALITDLGKPPEVIKRLITDGASAQDAADELEVTHAGNGNRSA